MTRIALSAALVAALADEEQQRIRGCLAAAGLTPQRMVLRPLAGEIEIFGRPVSEELFSRPPATRPEVALRAGDTGNVAVVVVGALMAALVFGFADSLQQKLALLRTPIPSEFLAMAPYIATIVVVAGFVGRSRPPAADGKPYIKS